MFNGILYFYSTTEEKLMKDIFTYLALGFVLLILLLSMIVLCLLYINHCRRQRNFSRQRPAVGSRFTAHSEQISSV